MPNTQSDQNQILIKVVLIGNSAVGKSSLLMRYTENEFSLDFFNTIGVDFKKKTIEIDNLQCQMQIWDTAGQERFRTITCSYYKGANGILIAYDITDKDSFDSVKVWLNEIEKHAQPNTCKLLIGNKKDLEDRRKVSYEDGLAFGIRIIYSANSLNIPFIETSSKTGEKVNEAFEKLAQDIFRTQKNTSSNKNSRYGLKIKPQKVINKPSQQCEC